MKEDSVYMYDFWIWSLNGSFLKFSVMASTRKQAEEMARSYMEAMKIKGVIHNVESV